MTSPGTEARELAALADSMRRGGIERVEITAGARRWVVQVEAPAAPAAAPPPAAGPAPATIVSPGIGRLVPVHPARAGREVEIGETFGPGQILAYLEAGGLLLPVTAARQGRLLGQLAEDGALVGYGQALFAMTETG